MKNHTIESTNNNKKSKIVEIGNNKIIAKRIFVFFTTMGKNSVGNEISYNDFNTALIEEKKWVNE